MNAKLPNHTYTRPRAAYHNDVTSLLYSICNFDFVVTIVIVQMCVRKQYAEYCHSSMQTVTGTWHNAFSSSRWVIPFDVRECNW
jgi:hypothetical protein